MDNWAYTDPGDIPDPFNPFESDEYILYLIDSGKIPQLEGV